MHRLLPDDAVRTIATADARPAGSFRGFLAGLVGALHLLVAALRPFIRGDYRPMLQMDCHAWQEAAVTDFTKDPCTRLPAGAGRAARLPRRFPCLASQKRSSLPR